jgi:hypothetical protein
VVLSRVSTGTYHLLRLCDQCLWPRRQVVSDSGHEGYLFWYLDLRFEVSTAVTMKNPVFLDAKPQFVPIMKRYVSATEPSRLMIYKV